MTIHSLSIIIPTRNAAGCLPALLDSLTTQQLDLPRELLVIDSASEDGTQQLAERAGAHLVAIEAHDFDHGTTRSQAAAMAQGTILVFLTQDALPADQYSIARLIAPLRQSEEIAACCGRQLPHADASLFGAHLRFFNYGNQSVVRRYEERQRFGLKTVFISNSFAAYHKKALQKVGYFGENQLFAEDALAVGRMLKKGYACAYVAEAEVFHSHNYSLSQEFRRYFDVGVFHSCNAWLLREFGGAGGEGRRFVCSELAYLLNKGRPDLLPLSLLRSMVKLAGYRAGVSHLVMPRWLRPLCSMNPAWWRRTGQTRE